jgi:radical SAM protein with 4Fe4S-binding SPASM domain
MNSPQVENLNLNKKNGDETTWEMIPVLRSFITTRKEHFGGFIYNPYLQQPAPLSTVEVEAIELFDGHRTVKDIYNLIVASKHFYSSLSKKQFLSIFHRLSQYFAIKWKNGGETVSEDNRIKCNIPEQKTIQDIKSISHLSAPLSVLWDVTYACNLSCTHCLSSSGEPLAYELTLEEIKKTIDQLSTMKVFTITFCGGEPLIRKDFFNILEYATNHNMGLKISTNGVLVTDQALKKLDDYNVFAVKVSLDGTEKTHDKFRNLSGAYQKAINAIKRLAEAGFYTVVAPVITKFNVHDMDHVFEKAVEEGASAFQPSLFMPAGRGKANMQDLILTSQEIKHYMARLMEKRKEYQNIIDIVLEGIYPGLQTDNGDETLKHTCIDNVSVGCSAGNAQIVITASGKVVPCSFLYDFVAGDVRNEGLRSIWHYSPVLESFRNLKKNELKGKCRNCEYVPERCQGGCRAAAYLYSGDLYAEDPICWNYFNNG